MRAGEASKRCGRRYNRATLKPLRLIYRFVLLLSACCALALTCFSQVSPTVARTLLILPFDNRSNSPGLEWIGESFPEILSQRLASPSLYLVGREDRVYAFDRMGIPVAAHPSRATVYRVAEQLDCDYLVVGDYSFDGQTFTAHARILDMRRLRELPPIESSGPLVNLIDIQTNLAWEVLKTVRPETTITREELVRSSPFVRLDAFENYTRGIVASTRQEKVRRFREAVRLNPQYTLAMLQLGKTYYANREYDSASLWLARIPQSDSRAGEAYFLLGLAYYYQGQFDRAEEALKVTAARFPLTEVYNNLGAIALRRGKKTAVPLLQRAVEIDPNDPDYRFNLSLALYRSGDAGGAIKNLRDSLAKYPTDIDARQLLDEVSSTASAPPQAAANDSAVTPTALNTQNRLPLPRLKRNYDENSFRLLALEIQNSAKPRADFTLNQSTAFHVRHGMELLDHGLATDAEREFRVVLMTEPGNPIVHMGLARAAAANGDTITARREATTSISLHPLAAAYLVLARLDLKQNQLHSAAHNVDQALALEPANAEAITLKQGIAARDTQALESPR